MAIINKNVKPLKNDRDENIFIGIDLPFRKSEGRDGWFTSTTTTIEAVKNNIRNLLLTERGERVMQPRLGVKLRKYLFEPFTTDVKIAIQNQVVDTFAYWLPYVTVKKIDVDMSSTIDDSHFSTLNISIEFILDKQIDSTESIQVTIGE